MATAFQPSAFQNNAFQIDVTVSPPKGAGSPGGQGAGRRKHKRVLVIIDRETFEVETQMEALDLLAQARELAEQQAQILAEAALFKAGKAKRATAKARALDIAVPLIEFRAEDTSDEFAQMVRAQVEAAQAAIQGIYAKAIQDAREGLRRQQEQDEEDAVILLLLS